MPVGDERALREVHRRQILRFDPLVGILRHIAPQQFRLAPPCQPEAVPAVIEDKAVDNSGRSPFPQYKSVATVVGDLGIAECYAGRAIDHQPRASVA